MQAKKETAVIMENVWPLIGGIVFFIEAVLDGTGFRCPEQYSESPILREWQKKRFIAEIIASAGCWILFFSPEEKTGYFVAGSAVCAAGLILCCVIDCGYKKKASKIAPLNRQE